MALPKFYADAMEKAQAARKSIADKEQRVKDLAAEIQSKTTEMESLKKEVENDKNKQNSPVVSELPFLLFHRATELGGCKDGHEQYYHDQIYYFADSDLVKSVPVFDKSDSFKNKTLPGTINLITVFRQSGKDEQSFARELQGVIASILEGTEVSTWEEVGELVVKHYGVDTD